MMPFTYQAVRTEQEAIAGALAGGRYIAGGTTLIDLMREEVERPERLIDINSLPLGGIELTGERLVIGALARMADVAADPRVKRAQPLLVEALLEGASPQLRNMASIGGNLLQRVRCPYFRSLDAACNKRTPRSGCAALHGLNHRHAILGASAHCVAVHPSDLAVALVALEAVIVVRGPSGLRRLPVENLYRLPDDTPHLEHDLAPGELIIAVEIEPGPHARHGRYVKVRDRASYDFALASAAVTLELEHGVIRAARIAVGGVATRPWRVRPAEAVLCGRAPGAAAWDAAAALALEGARPLAHNGYKVELLRRTIVRALELAGAAS